MVDIDLCLQAHDSIQRRTSAGSLDAYMLIAFGFIYRLWKDLQYDSQQSVA